MRPLKINYVSYFHPLYYNGGGEMIMRQIIESGEKRSHEFAFKTIRPYRNRQHKNADITFLTDVFNFPHTLKSFGNIRRFGNRYLKKIVHNSKFIHFNNAYSDICNMAHLPCSGNTMDKCPYKSALNIRRNIALRDFSNRCFRTRPLVRMLFERSVLNVFLSPLHHRVTHKVLKMSSNHRHSTYIMKPIIDPELFYDRKIERDINYLFVGLIGEAKGLAQMRTDFKSEDIWLIGKIAPREKLDFGKYVGFIPYEKVPEYMSRAKHFVFLPRWPEPQGRVVIEAALCGCRLITNENVGATSFDFELYDQENFSNAKSELWNKIEELI